MFRATCLALPFLIVSIGLAQPGPHGMDVLFALYDQGVHRPADELRQDSAFHLVMDGRSADVQSFRESWFCYAGFSPHNSDPSNHRDTLWMQVGLHGSWMWVGFPPWGLREADWYIPSGLRIDFRPGRFLVNDLPKELHVSGVVRNHDDLLARMPDYTMQLRSGTQWSSGPVLDRATGRINGIVSCHTSFIDHQEWVDLTLFVHDGHGGQRSEMHVRSGYFLNYDLDTFDLLPNRYFFNAERLWIDGAVPRDTTVVGVGEGVRSHMHPINPTMSDTLRIEAEWPSSGAPVITNYRTRERKGVTRITFTFAVRTDVKVLTESWTERSTIMELSELPPGRYVLAQEANGDQHARDVDLLLGREIPFNVGVR